MFDKYINYNRVVEEMIRDHEDRVAALESIDEQYRECLSSLDGLTGVKYDGASVKTSLALDVQVNAHIRREVLEKQFQELKREIQIYDRAWEKLTQEEKEILHIFFRQDMKKEDAACILMEAYQCERATIYRKRTNALRRFKILLFG